MNLTRDDLWSLEQYAENRAEFRATVLEHKKYRTIQLHENARLLFEDDMTLRYQIQEMLRIEKVFEADGIQEELDTYNPMMPDGNNWKATFMIEYDDVPERREKLAGLIGVERLVWMQVHELEKVYAIADEDLPRENEVKTSSVHFMRFQLTDEMIYSALNGQPIFVGCDHKNMLVSGFEIDHLTVQSLLGDLSN